MKTGDYSINDIKQFFLTFNVDDIIETTIYYKGTYMRLVYKIKGFENYGIMCQLLKQEGNYGGEYVNNDYNHLILLRLITNEALKKYFVKSF